MPATCYALYVRPDNCHKKQPISSIILSFDEIYPSVYRIDRGTFCLPVYPTLNTVLLKVVPVPLEQYFYHGHFDEICPELTLNQIVGCITS